MASVKYLMVLHSIASCQVYSGIQYIVVVRF